jgi:hypothetical protein
MLIKTKEEEAGTKTTMMMRRSGKVAFIKSIVSFPSLSLAHRKQFEFVTDKKRQRLCM